jgi:RNA polymerase sigma-70 factor (ECF subfamily)
MVMRSKGSFSSPAPAPGRWDFRGGELPFRPALFATALKLTRNRQDAEDLVQETYLKGWSHYDGFTEGTNLKAWLFRILRNSFINGYRRIKAAPKEVDLAATAGAFEEALGRADREERTPEALLVSSTMDGSVAAALSKLPEEFRRTVEMSDLEDRSYREIAATLKIPIGTVMSRLYRGRRLLEPGLLEYGRRRHYLAGRPARTRRDAEPKKKAA